MRSSLRLCAARVIASNTPTSIYQNNLLRNFAQNRVSTALGVKSFPVPETVHLAKVAGYDTLFVDLEHTTISTKEASHLCMTALALGITPFVRIPHQSGNGIAQRVLDAGAMGFITPHVDTVEQAENAAYISKYPPIGGRSNASGYAQFGLAPVPATHSIKQLNETGSTVFVQIETRKGLENVFDIAAVPGVDVLMVGANDLSLELGDVGNFDNQEFIEALQKVGEACKQHGKIFGIAGIYARPDLMARIVNDFGARWILGANDQSLLLQAMCANNAGYREIKVR